jgi:UDP-galactopyranose mutase
MSAPLAQPNPFPALFDADDNPLICFSHLRWDFVLQRPQHLMQRFAAKRRVFFFEEYIPTDHSLPYLEYHPFAGTEVVAVRPRLPRSWGEAEREKGLAALVDLLLKLNRVGKPVLWFYTPMMYGFARHVDAAAVIYDCMDELANFRFAPPRLRVLEAELLKRADAVFTGGYSLYEAKRHAHSNIHPFPSSVDTAHFAKARRARQPGKTFGFYGVIDERMDLELLAQVAALRPQWRFEIVGPVVKINPADLPQAPNLSFVGQRDYADLPGIVAEWDVALMPFAVNEATRFISPTKTPEYLAAGKPVVSTPVPDVVRQYGNVRGVSIAAGAAEFVAACEDALALAAAPGDWLPGVDRILGDMSWDKTALNMDQLVRQAIGAASVPLRVLNGRTSLGVSSMTA